MRFVFPHITLSCVPHSFLKVHPCWFIFLVAPWCGERIRSRRVCGVWCATNRVVRPCFFFAALLVLVLMQQSSDDTSSEIQMGVYGITLRVVSKEDCKTLETILDELQFASFEEASNKEQVMSVFAEGLGAASPPKRRKVLKPRFHVERLDSADAPSASSPSPELKKDSASSVPNHAAAGKKKVVPASKLLAPKTKKGAQLVGHFVYFLFTDMYALVQSYNAIDEQYELVVAGKNGMSVFRQKLKDSEWEFVDSNEDVPYELLLVQENYASKTTSEPTEGRATTRASGENERIPVKEEETAGESGTWKRPPRDRPPNGKTWSDAKGKYVDKVAPKETTVPSSSPSEVKETPRGGRPRGRPPNGKTWSDAKGKYVDKVAPKETTVPSSSSSEVKETPRGRPRGRPPNGKTWSDAEGKYVDG